MLVGLITKYKDVIEDKKVDSSSWSLKKKAWEEVANALNACHGIRCHRPPSNIKEKYNGLKKAVKKKLGAIRQGMYGTGGGAPCQVSLTPLEEKVAALMKQAAAHGMDCQVDSDFIPGTPYLYLYNSSYAIDLVSVSLVSSLKLLGSYSFNQQYGQ